MKTLRILSVILRSILALLLLLFSLAIVFGGNYGQALLLILASIPILYWPTGLNLRRGHALMLRILAVIVLVTGAFSLFRSEPPTTIYTSEENERELMDIYEEKLSDWPSDTREMDISTAYGTFHLLNCGKQNLPPLVLLHAASMGAPSWAENVTPLLDHFCIYAIDNIGEGNWSRLDRVDRFPQTEKELADLYISLFDSLGIEEAVVFGASNGGFIAQSLAFHYPERVSALLLFGPMGLTQLSVRSIFNMTISSMYPLPFIRRAVTRWAIGTDPYVSQKYGDWFDCVMKASIPSFARPVPMNTAMKQQMNMPVLLFLGTADPIVGDAETAREAANEYPDITVKVLDSGHLIAVEERDEVNRQVLAEHSLL